jgi:hypothetical protein
MDLKDLLASYLKKYKNNGSITKFDWAPSPNRWAQVDSIEMRVEYS